MPSLSRILAIVAFALLAILLVRKWTGGGETSGGGSEWVPEPPSFERAETFLEHENSGKTLSWNQPAKRQDGSALGKDDLLGYVVILLPEKAIADNEFSKPFEGLNSRNFGSIKKQLNRALNTDSLGEFVKRHSVYAAVLPAGQNNIVVPLSDDTVFAAIAAIDGNGLYGDLSATIALTLDEQ